MKVTDIMFFTSKQVISSGRQTSLVLVRPISELETPAVAETGCIALREDNYALHQARNSRCLVCLIAGKLS